MLKYRIFSSIVLLIAGYLVFGLGDKYIFYIGSAVISIVALYEWAQFLSLKSFFSKAIYALVSSIPLAGVTVAGLLSKDSFILTLLTPIIIFSMVWWILAIFFIVRFPKSTAFIKDKAISAILGTFLVLAFYISLLLLRFYNYKIGSGLNILLYIICVVAATDIGAYTFGRLFGKHKLIPNVSPGKTIEGFIGGIVTAIIVSQIFLALNIKQSPLCLVPEFKLTLITLATALISVLGDLSESMFKRLNSVKDSGYIIPGHGGVLDRIDSLLAAIPLFTILFFALLS
ncbi:MAG: phosphatidate cytidylyltransferase [Psittacicella sp.]